MNGNYDHIALLLCLHTVNHLLGKVRHQRLELHTRPKERRKPALYVRVGETYDGDVQALPLQCHIFLEIRLSVVSADGIGCKERNLHGLDQTVIYRMSGLYVMVTDHDCIISHMLDHTGKKML